MPELSKLQCRLLFGRCQRRSTAQIGPSTCSIQLFRCLSSYSKGGGGGSKEHGGGGGGSREHGGGGRGSREHGGGGRGSREQKGGC